MAIHPRDVVDLFQIFLECFRIRTYIDILTTLSSANECHVFLASHSMFVLEMLDVNDISTKGGKGEKAE